MPDATGTTTNVPFGDFLFFSNAGPISRPKGPSRAGGGARLTSTAKSPTRQKPHSLSWIAEVGWLGDDMAG